MSPPARAGESGEGGSGTGEFGAVESGTVGSGTVGSGEGEAGTVEARPPRAPLVIIGAVAVLTAPLAVVAIGFGDLAIGGAALLSAAWAASIATVGWTARAVADPTGIEVRWMGSTTTVAWVDVAAVEVDHGGWGGGRGGLLRKRDGTTLRWTPWLPLLWFASRSARASAVDLLDLAEDLARRGVDVEVFRPSPR